MACRVCCFCTLSLIIRVLSKHSVIHVYSYTRAHFLGAIYHTVVWPRREQFPETPSLVKSFVVGCNLKSKGQELRACLALRPLAWGAGCYGRIKGRPHALLTSSLQEERSRSEHNLVNIQKTHERMQTENKSE